MLRSIVGSSLRFRLLVVVMAAVLMVVVLVVTLVIFRSAHVWVYYEGSRGSNR